jgi:16S rRNA (guanine527-N7)-methyltransferase
MLTSEQSTLLINGAGLLQVDLTETQVSQFVTYLEELNLWSKIADLVSQSDPEVIIRKHILDSLAALSILPKNGRLLDLGSGAGFPGIPIAIAAPALSVTLLEPRRKRVNFLKEVIRKVRLTNAHAYEGRVEEFAEAERWKSAFSIVITRATWNIRELLTQAKPFLANEGIVVAMKGEKAEEELRDEETWLKRNSWVLQRWTSYILPFGKEKRSLLVFSPTEPSHATQ